MEIGEAAVEIAPGFSITSDSGKIGPFVWINSHFSSLTIELKPSRSTAAFFVPKRMVVGWWGVCGFRKLKIRVECELP